MRSMPRMGYFIVVLGGCRGILTGDKKDWVLFDAMAKIGRPHRSYLESFVPE